MLQRSILYCTTQITPCFELVAYAWWHESFWETNSVDMHYSWNTIAFDTHLTESTGSIPLPCESKPKWQQFVLEILTSDEVTISAISPDGLVLYLWLYTLVTGRLFYVFISCHRILLVSFFYVKRNFKTLVSMAFFLYVSKTHLWKLKTREHKI